MFFVTDVASPPWSKLVVKDHHLCVKHDSFWSLRPCAFAVLYVAHTDHNTGYYNVEVLVPLSAITTTSDSASASEQATPPPKPQWQSWVTGVAWYPDNNPLIAKESQIICNIESSEQAKAGSPNTVSVVATQLLVQQRLKPNHSEHRQFVQRESIQQVKQMLRLLHDATGQGTSGRGSGSPHDPWCVAFKQESVFSKYYLLKLGLFAPFRSL